MTLSSSLSHPLATSANAGKLRSVRTRITGFTLLELLVVILIIGIIISFASISIGQNTSRIVQDEAERLHGLVQLASEEAVLQGRELALEFNRHGYRFLELGDKGWLPVDTDQLLRERPLPDVINIELKLEGTATSFEDKKNLPKVFILSSGELTPFDLMLSTDEDEKYDLAGEITGKLKLTRVENDES